MTLNPYRAIARNDAFRRFWLGFTFSAFGDSLTRVALTWYVYEQTQSPEALGWLMLCYTGPVVVGGLLAGWLLDRVPGFARPTTNAPRFSDVQPLADRVPGFARPTTNAPRSSDVRPLAERLDRRWVMAADNVLRGLAVALIPLLHALGALALWHIYAVAAVYGFLMMISLAGGPALIPSLVTRDQLQTANALETLSFTLAGVAGPLLAGLLITWIGAPNILWIDAVSYLVFAWALAGIRATPPRQEAQPARGAFRLDEAVRLLLTQPVLLATTLMFMAANLGIGGLAVWLPVLSDQALGGGPELYGVLLGAWALGEVASAVVAGGRWLRAPLGALICLAQFLAGTVLALMLLGSGTVTALAALVLFGVFSAPLTIWAQTLRMEIIPERLRGRTFALLRMLMQSGGPLGSALAGLALPALGLPAMIALSALVVGLPGLVGYRVPELRSAGAPTLTEGERA